LRCPNSPNKEENKRQKVSASTIDGNIDYHSYGKFERKSCQEELVKLFVEFEHSFLFVEHLAFRGY